MQKLNEQPAEANTPSGLEAVQGLKADTTFGERFRFERFVSELSARFVQIAPGQLDSVKYS